MLQGGPELSPGVAAAWRLPGAAQQCAGFSGAAQPANAMALIKELRERSGAPISDVKVRRRTGLSTH